MEVVCIRPPLVYGKQSKGNLHFLIKFIKLRIKGLQIFISSLLGYLLPGGLQGIPFTMKVSSIDNLIALSIFSNNNPLLEIKDTPFLSSSTSGGPSIINNLEFIFP